MREKRSIGVELAVRRLGGLLAALALSVTALAGGEGDEDGEFLTNQAIFELAGGADIAAVVADYGLAGVMGSLPAQNLYLVELPAVIGEEQFEDQYEDSFEADERIVEAELNGETDPPGGQTQDFYVSVGASAYDQQYAWVRIHLGAAQQTADGSGVVVALLDGGVDLSHPALAAAIMPGGYNFVDRNADVSEASSGALVGHGTFVAGLVARIAPQASILPVKVLDGDGHSLAFRVAEGIYFAIDQGADIINLSLGGAVQNQIVSDALAAAREAGIVLVAAAGNTSQALPAQYPAAEATVIAVASTDSSDVKSLFSAYGPHVALSAPGTDVVSTVPGGGYGIWDGTSLSAAMVSGVAALVRSLDPAASVEQVEATLSGAADDLDGANPAYAGMLGAGRLDAAESVGVEPLIGDLDADGEVGVADLVILISAWGQSASPADLDGGGSVAVGDLVILIANWG